MKLWLLLAGGVTLLFAWLALRAPQDETLPQAAALRTAAPPAAALPRTPPPVPLATTPTGIRVHGVMVRGGQQGESQALMSVQGGAAHVFRVGEPVAQGWALAEVEKDHVVLASGSARARIEVTYSTAAPAPSDVAAAPRAAAAAVPVSMPVRNPLPGEEPLPGFVKAPGQAAPPAPSAANLETNRRFQDAMRKRSETRAER